MERTLVECVRQGRELDFAVAFSPSADIDAAAGDEQRTIRAHVVRGLLLGRLVADPDPRGVAIRGARILGRLNIEHVDSALPLALRDCLLDEGIGAREARLEAVDLTGSRLWHPTEPALDATGLVVRAGLCLDRIRARAQCVRGTVVLGDAEVGGILSCAEAILDNDAGPALSAAGLHLRRSADLGPGLVATGAGALGAVRLTGARVGGDLNLAGAQLRNSSGPALVAEGARIESSILLTAGFEASGADASPAVALRGARVAGVIDARGAVLSNSEGCALDVSEADIGGDVMLGGVVGGEGAVLMLSARIGGLVEARGARLRNPAASALDAENAQVGQDLFLDRGFTATGEARQRRPSTSRQRRSAASSPSTRLASSTSTTRRGAWVPTASPTGACLESATASTGSTSSAAGPPGTPLSLTSSWRPHVVQPGTTKTRVAC